jgi:AbrB family looped-hinge helix DNA binding protein
MPIRHVVAIDRAGRLVVPKALRDELAVVPGQPLDAEVRDGRLEIVPRALEADLVETDGLLIVVPRQSVPPMTAEDVRTVLDSVRR